MRDTPLWVFDLDNTLHDARPHIFPHINRAMTEYIRDHVGNVRGAGPGAMTLEQAGALRMHYWRTYGATLAGLVRHHGVQPPHFLWHTHQFESLERMVVAERGLRQVLARLPGRKVILSNAPTHYARAVIGILGIGPLFDAVYCMEQMRFRPKPDPSALRMVLRAEGVPPRRAVLVEDTLANLRSARRLGVRTVWISTQAAVPRWVDARLHSVLALPGIARRFRNNVPGRLGMEG